MVIQNPPTQRTCQQSISEGGRVIYLLHSFKVSEPSTRLYFSSSGPAKARFDLDQSFEVANGQSTGIKKMADCWDVMLAVSALLWGGGGH